MTSTGKSDQNGHVSLLVFYSGLSTWRAKVDLVTSLCRLNALHLPQSTATSDSAPSSPPASPLGTVAANAANWTKWSVCHPYDVCRVLSHFACAWYASLAHVTVVVDYVWQILQDEASAAQWWIAFAPGEGGSYFVRSVARTLAAEDGLRYLFMSKNLQKYLGILRYAAEDDAAATFRQLAMDDEVLADATALQTILLIPGRLAQQFPEVSLELVSPMIDAVQHIFACMARDPEVADVLLHVASPSSVRIVMENLQLIPRAAKGLRLAVARCMIRVLVEVSEFSTHRDWMEEFALSDGPFHVLFTVCEWCTEPHRLRSTFRGSTPTTAAAPQIRVVGNSSTCAATDDNAPERILAETARGAEENDNTTLPPQPPQLPFDAQDVLVYDMLCVLLALPDDASPFQLPLYDALRSLPDVRTFEESEATSLRFEEAVVAIHAGTQPREMAFGQFGFRVLVTACATAYDHRPSLWFFLCRMLLFMLRVFREPLVEMGLVSTDVCLSLTRFLTRAVRRHSEVVAVTDPSDDRATMGTSPANRDFDGVGWHDAERNNEHQFHLVTVTQLLVACCKNQTLQARQEDGLPALAALVAQLATSLAPLSSATIVKTLLFHLEGLGETASQLVLETLVTDGEFFKLASSEIAAVGNEVPAASAVPPSASHSIRRLEYLLALLRVVCQRCPKLQAYLIPYTSNITQLIGVAAGNPAQHDVLAPCSDLLAGLNVDVHDKSNVVCHSLLGTLLALNPCTARSLVGCCWALQTCVRLVASERTVQTFFELRVDELYKVLGRLCTCLNQLRHRCGDKDLVHWYTLLPASHRHRRDAQCELVPPLLEVPSAPHPDSSLMMVGRGGEGAGTSAGAVDDEAATGSAPPEKTEEVAVTQSGDASPSAGRQPHPEERPESASATYYLLCCDVLHLLLHLVNLIHCARPRWVADDSMSHLVRHLAAGPFLRCRLFTSLVARWLWGMSCLTNQRALAETEVKPKLSMLTQPPPPNSNRVSLADLRGGWIVCATVGDTLSAVHQHRIVRPQFVRVLLELVRVAPCLATIRGFELLVSVVEMLYHASYHRSQNFFVLSSCGVWDAVAGQLVRLTAAQPDLRSLCVQVLSNAMRLFGLYGVGTLPSHVMFHLCVEPNPKRYHQDDLRRALAHWDWMLQSSLPCRMPHSFLSLVVGTETRTKQRSLYSSVAALHKTATQLTGGIDIATAYDVWKLPTDSHLSVVMWVMLDPSPSHVGDAVLCSLHFDRSRLVVELGCDVRANLYVSVMYQSMGTMRTRRINLGKLQLPHRQWALVHFTMENFAAKSNLSIRSKFSMKFQVGIQSMHSHQQRLEASVVTPGVDIHHSIRDRSFGNCTTLSFLCMGGLRRNSIGNALYDAASASSTPHKGSQRPAADGDHPHHHQSSTAACEDAALASPLAAGGAASAIGVATAPDVAVPHELFIGSLAVFHGELAPFDPLVFFALGSDALFSLDFTDRGSIVHLFPMIARLATEHQRSLTMRDMALLASMWMRQQEPSHDAGFPSVFTGYFPFTKAHRDRIVCAIGVSHGDLCMWTRLESVSSVSSSDSSGGLSGSSGVNASVGGAASPMSRNDSFAVPQTPRYAERHSSVAGASVPSFAAAGAGAGAGVPSSSSGHAAHHASQSALPSAAAAAAAAPPVEFVCLPKQKPLVHVSFELLVEDGVGFPTPVDDMFWRVETVTDKPVVYSISPLYTILDALGGLSTLLWIASVQPRGSPTEQLSYDCIGSYLAYHVDSPLSCSDYTTKRQDLTLLSVLLHTRLEISKALADCITRCAGFPLLSRVDLVPILTDFSLWGRDSTALNAIMTYLTELISVTNPAHAFNAELLRCRRHDQQNVLLEEVLFHLHMHFAGMTVAKWCRETVEATSALLLALCHSPISLTSIAASAAWLANQGEKDVAWVHCLLDTVVATIPAMEKKLRDSSDTLPASLINVLKSKHASVRYRALRCLLHLPLPMPMVVSMVAQYEARRLEELDRRTMKSTKLETCISDDEILLLAARLLGNETWVAWSDDQRTISVATHAMTSPDAAPLSARPIAFFFATLLPYLSERQQLAVVRLFSDAFQCAPSLQAAMLDSAFHRPLSDAPFTSYVIYALAETFERNDRALEVGDGPVVRALVELLVDLCAAALVRPTRLLSSGVGTAAAVAAASPGNAAQSRQASVNGVSVVREVLYSIFNVFVEEDEIGVRSPTPLFHCARHHMLNICCACLQAIDGKIDVASSAQFLDNGHQFLELVHDVSTLLYVPSRLSSREDMQAMTSPRTGRVMSDANQTVVRFCAYFDRVGCTTKSLRVRKPYVALLEPDSAAKESAAAPHVSRDNIELVPIYLLQCASKLFFKVQAGASPAVSQLDKSSASRLLTNLQQLQLRTTLFLLTIESPHGFDSALDELQTLALMHAYHICSATYGLQPAAAHGSSSGSAKKRQSTPGAAGAASGGGSSSSVAPVLTVPPRASWSAVDMADCALDTLLVAALVKHKEASLATLSCCLRRLGRVADSGVCAEAQVTTNASSTVADLCLQVSRILLFHQKSSIGKKDFVDRGLDELDHALNRFRSARTMLVDTRAIHALQHLGHSLFTPNAAAALQKVIGALVNAGVSRALDNLRVASSYFSGLDPTRARYVRETIDGTIQRLQAHTLKRAGCYHQLVEQDSHLTLAANAAYRFSLVPWWGPLTSLYTDQPVPLNRWELDRFMGPDWERSRLRRFAHEPKMKGPGKNNHTRFFQPLQHDISHDLDDMELIQLFGVTAAMQAVNQRILQTDAHIRCVMVLPMDRVPVLLSLSQIALSIKVESGNRGLFASATSADVAPPPVAAEPDAEANVAELESKPRRTRSATMAQTTTSSGGKAVRLTKYPNEVPVHLRVVPISAIRAVWPRRNRLQPVALELLLDSGESVFLAFESSGERKAVMERIAIFAKPYLDKTLVLSESNLKLWRSWWSDGRISTFKYLMYLNISAGRSYGDMRQYPVFPHVIADYTSGQLDLRNPQTFRVLEKPMGAQTPEREEKVIRKYEEIAQLGFGDHESLINGTIAGHEIDLDMLPLHYGSHYLPPGGALHFLVRVQPFGDYFLYMNSKLDDADRVFESMAKAYSISSTGKDVKEMVPEFYSLPDMYINRNQVPFGVKQDGGAVDDVLLPPWADSPRSFVVTMREALESRYVSERIHSWIDLIFGYKQRGREAVLAVNVFHPLTYEGTVDLSAITDPVRYRSHVTQIDSFGQMPIQLFSRGGHKPRCKPTSDFYSTPCPTLRFDNAFAKNSVLLFYEKLNAVISSSSSASASMVNASHGEASWITYCRSPASNAALGADELGEWLLSTGVTSRTPYHVLPTHVLPFTIVGDTPKDFVILRPHTLSIADAKDLSRDVAVLRVSKSPTTVAAAQAPFVYVGTASGALVVVEIRYDEITEVEILPPVRAPTSSGPTPSSSSSAGGGAPSPSGGATMTGGTQRGLVDNDNSVAVSTSRLWGDGKDEMNFLDATEHKQTRVRTACMRLVDCIHGHHGAIVAVTVAVDWGLLVTVAQDWVVAVWDLNRRVLLRTLPSPDLLVSVTGRSVGPLCDDPSSLFHQRLLIGSFDFFPSLVSVNPSRGDIVLAGVRSDRGVFRGEINVHTVNGELCASTPWKALPTAVLAIGPVIFAAEGRSVVVLDSITLQRRHELMHPQLEDTIVSISLNPYGTCIAAVDKSGCAGTWKVG